MKKIKKRKAHNILLYATTAIITTVFLVSMCNLAYGKWGWFITFCLSFAWLSFVAWANNFKGE
jgi:hypothetical protein